MTNNASKTASRGDKREDPANGPTAKDATLPPRPEKSRTRAKAKKNPVRLPKGNEEVSDLQAKHDCMQAQVEMLTKALQDAGVPLPIPQESELEPDPRKGKNKAELRRVLALTSTGKDLRDTLNRKKARKDYESSKRHDESNENFNIQQQLDQFKKELVRELKGGAPHYRSALSNKDEQDAPPFVPAILNEPSPLGSRLPTFTKYDGTSDPTDHVEVYESVMNFHAYSGAMKCRGFSATLTGSARRWYRRLTPYSISSWRQLRKAFISHFAAHQEEKHDETYLSSIKQRSEESLRDYVKRFLAELSKVENCPDAVARSAFITGVTHDELAWAFAKKPVPTLKACLKKTWEYIDAEEVIQARGGKSRRSSSPHRDYDRSEGRLEDCNGSSRRPEANDREREREATRPT